MSILDRDRIQAQAKLIAQAVTLHGARSPVVQKLRKQLSTMQDDELRRRLALQTIELEARRRERSESDSDQVKMIRELGLLAGFAATDVQELASKLDSVFGISVAPDGLIECERLTESARQLIGARPVALYHHTASPLANVIRQEGLKVGKQTNFFNTQAGVYLSTIRAGTPVSTYSRRAAKVYGGEPITIRVSRTLDQLRPDPDDEDLVWAQGRQFVTPFVPPQDLADAELSRESDSDRLARLRQHPGWISDIEQDRSTP